MWIFLLIALFLPLTSHGSVDPADCLGCHEKLAGASHGGRTCTDCHKDIKELPHGEKLERPACRLCHDKEVKDFQKSVHRAKKLTCKSCHNAHAPSQSKKTCASCHTYDHVKLPSTKKHMETLQCTACHGSPKQGKISVQATLPRGHGLGKRDVDIDGNARIDAKEWNGLALRLAKEYKKPVPVKRTYHIDGNVHAITEKPVDCQGCHGKESIFKDATLRVSNDKGFKIPIDRTAFLPELPDIEKYQHTPHGKNGVACKDCHTSQERISDAVCARCHEDAFNTYKGSSHATKKAAQCTDCHNPHSVAPYAGLTAEERVSICARCHGDYLKQHRWLPNTMLHFKYLECSSCHSPLSTKSIVFHLAKTRDNGQIPLDRHDIEKAYGVGVDIRAIIDKNRDNAVTSEELSNFFHETRARLAQPIFVGSAIITTKVHHDYSVKEMRDKLCSTCHSDNAPFYDSMFLTLPGKGGQVRIPVKGTVLSALPTSVFIDMCLLGETKIKRADWQKIMQTSGRQQAYYIRELGFKWIDFGGVVIILIACIVIGIHSIGRIFFKR